MADVVGTTPRIQNELATVEPGSQRAAEIARRDAQQGAGADFLDGLGLTFASDALRKIEQEAPLLYKEQTGQEVDFNPLHAPSRIKAVAMSLMGFRAGEKDYDKDKEYDKLTAGIPFEYHDDIMENDNLAAAQRARNRVLEDMDRGRRIAMQDDGQLAVLAGSMIDADMPASFFSGGAYGAAKMARMGLRLGRMAKLGEGTALRLSGMAQGANAALQGGAAIGALQAYESETVGWQDMANMALQSMFMGGIIGTATKGDIRTTIRAAHDEFLNNVAKDAPAFKDNVDVNSMHGADLKQTGPFIVEHADDGTPGPSTVGALQSNPNVSFARPSANLTDLSPTNRQWVEGAEEWRHDSGWGDRKRDDEDLYWTKVATAGLANLTTGDFKALWKSKSAVANYAAGNIFESANGLGRGGATAAARMENYTARIQQHLGPAWMAPMWEWAKNNGATWKGSGYHISEAGKQVFNREVMLELSDRRMGRGSTRAPEVKRAADQIEIAGHESLGILVGRQGETPVDGFQSGMPPRKGYTPYRWNGRRIQELLAGGNVDKDTIVAAMADGYRSAGMFAGKDADAVAAAVVHRAISKEIDMDMSVFSLLTGDGKDFMREAMVMQGMKEADADILLDRLIGAQHERGKESMAKGRNDIDFSTVIPTKDGSELRIVDLLDNDLHGVWQRYTRQVSGSAALARHGITNRAERREFIDAMIAEQRALGETPMERGRIEAMMSHFNPGPVHGYALGTTNEGIGALALAKRITNLSLLNKLGIAQLAETGVAMAQIGLSNWLERGPMAIFDQQLKAGNKAMLDDLAFLTGEIGHEHWHFANWLDLDDATSADTHKWLQGAQKWSSNAAFVQGYTSAFNAIRDFQQRTVALGMTDKIFRKLKEGMANPNGLDEATRLRFQVDLGLDADALRSLESLISSGTIEFGQRGSHTFVNKLNADTWDADIAETFGAAIRRNLNQVVQRSMAGEQDVWMNTHVASLFVHLKTFPLQAIQKQVMRNARFMDKEAVAMVLYGLATAAVASKVRDVVDGKDSTALETAKAAFNYSNLTGFIPLVYDPMMTLLGMDNARFNQFGPTYDWTPPVVSTVNKLWRAGGAMANTIKGDADWYDKQAIKAIPFMNSYVLSRMFD